MGGLSMPIVRVVFDVLTLIPSPKIVTGVVIGSGEPQAPLVSELVQPKNTEDCSGPVVGLPDTPAFVNQMVVMEILIEVGPVMLMILPPDEVKSALVVNWQVELTGQESVAEIASCVPPMS
jgi:hypothetical protein